MNSKCSDGFIFIERDGECFLVAEGRLELPLSPVFIDESYSTCPHTCPAFQNSHN